jgi:hypothetical protein
MENVSKDHTARISRRKFVTRAAATTGGVVASAYIKPELRRLGVPGAFAAVSTPPLPPLPPPLFAVAGPGRWGNSGNPTAARKEEWDELNDPDWAGLGTNPFVHTTKFNDFFTSHPDLDGLTMLDVVNGGGGPNIVLKTARDVVAAYLNAAYYGSSFSYTVAQISALWTAAINALPDTTSLEDLHEDLDAANNGA